MSIRGFFRFLVGAFGFLVLLALFSLIAVGVTVYIFNQVVERDTVKVPNVINLEVARAVEVLVKEGFQPEISEVYDPNFPPGKIVKQRPLPDQMVKRGRTVAIIKSGGNPQVVVPAVIGISPREADTLLLQDELEGGRVTWTYSDRVASGRILAQYPPPGVTALKSQRIGMLASLGPAPVHFRMPNYRGLPESDARTGILAAGLTLAAVELQHVEHQTAGGVIAQSPPPGEPVDPETPVTLRVAAAVDTDPLQGYAWLEFELPSTLGMDEVSVVVLDALGERELYRTRRPENGILTVIFRPVGGAQVFVYQDGQLVDQKYVEPNP